MVDYVSMGKRMKMKRRAKRMTQKELAKAVRVSPSFYGNIERGFRVPSIDTLVAIANTLCVGTDFLLADSLTHGADRHTPQEMALLYRYLRERIEELDYGTPAESNEETEEDEAVLQDDDDLAEEP